MFLNKTQAELDAAFLNAAGKHKFDKAKKLLEQGANPLAVDKDGNTALHRLSAFCPYYSGNYSSGLKDASLITEFICLLINKKLDVNARNNLGQTCLYPPIMYKKYIEKSVVAMVNILMGQGALNGVRDAEGRSLLHVAAFYGREAFINAYSSSFLIAVQDKNGKYPYEAALDGGHHALSRELLEKLRIYNNAKTAAAEKAKAEVKKAEAVVAPPAANEEWAWLKPKNIVQHVEEMGGYRLTHIFNFNVRTYTYIAHNLETKQDSSPTVKGFDDFADKALFVEAHRELTRLGGQVDEGVVYNQPLVGKDRAGPSFGQP